ncbi:hypothetical protein GCM10010430_50960 [Kitasatospora cystarginea]|uniref:Uncharacterized protein n=1 Tax=Kitasatospora cystarginea TaxID=58350 RepID=A0ABN3EKE5_9ACTN
MKPRLPGQVGPGRRCWGCAATRLHALAYRRKDEGNQQVKSHRGQRGPAGPPTRLISLPNDAAAGTGRITAATDPKSVCRVEDLVQPAEQSRSLVFVIGIRPGGLLGGGANDASARSEGGSVSSEF